MSATDEMTELLNTMYASFGSGDFSAFEARMGDDMLVIGTDEQEW